MDQLGQISCISVGDQLPPLSGKHVWLVAQILEANDTLGDQIFYTIQNPFSQYRRRVPELLGRRIRGCFHGWVIMSKHPHNVMWSLWNPSTSKFIRLPPMKHGLEAGDIDECYLTNPPDEPGSVLLLTRKEKPKFVFCRLDCKRKRLRWTEMSYAKQLKNATGKDGFIYSLTCCNGKVYALTTDSDIFVIEVDIVVKAKEVVISLMLCVKLPSRSRPGNLFMGPILQEGSCSRLLIISLCFKRTYVCCYLDLVTLDMTNMLWEEMEDLDDGETICFLGHDRHLLNEEINVIYSYNLKDKTMAISSMMPCLDLPQLTSYVSIWDIPKCKFEDDHEEINHSTVDSKQDDTTITSMTNQQHESHLFNYLPFHLLEMIMELCVDNDYVNFRATCTRLTKPVTLHCNEASITRLQRYSLVSPWLMVLDKDKGIITFTDPMFGDKYSLKTHPELNGDIRIWCSMYGWLLISKDTETMMLFNPFTSDIRKLPNLEIFWVQTFCFSASPSSPNCMLAGFGGPFLYIHFVAQKPASWLTFRLNFDGDAMSFFSFSTSYDRNLYALDHSNGRLSIFTDIYDEDNYSWVNVDVPPTSCSGSLLALYFLVKRDQDVILVMVDKFGESVELFKLDVSGNQWDKLDGLGKHMIYICDTTCLCMEARTPEMENKIFFAWLHFNTGKIVFYSLETCRYHTFNGKSIVDSSPNLLRTKRHLQYPHAWIEPSYS